MGRRWAALFIAGILLASAGIAAIIIWQASVHEVPVNYVIGASLVAIGVGFSVLHLSVSDKYLRIHFGGEENATRIRQMWRGGWVGAVIGVAMLAAQYILGGNR